MGSIGGIRRHWARCSVYAVARGIAEQHGVDWDQAFRMSWEAMRGTEEWPGSWYQILARMESVRNVPTVPERVMLMFQLNLRNRL